MAQYLKQPVFTTYKIRAKHQVLIEKRFVDLQGNEENTVRGFNRTYSHIKHYGECSRRSTGCSSCPTRVLTVYSFAWEAMIKRFLQTIMPYDEAAPRNGLSATSFCGLCSVFSRYAASPSSFSFTLPLDVGPSLKLLIENSFGFRES